MRSAVFIAALAIGTACVAAQSTPVLDDDLIAEINSRNVGWKAGRNAFFEGMSVGEVKSFLMTDLTPSKLPEKREYVASTPSSFDSRTKWPKCIGPIMDQAKCGSCWAFGAAEAMSDRMCIEGNGTYVQLAPLDLVACDNGWFNNGCQGGQPSAAWQWGQSNGLVTEGCLPYLKSEGGPIPTCAPADEPCLNFVQTPACNPKCANGANYQDDKHKLSNVYNVPGGVPAMQAELMKNGPFEVSMTVYSDFVHYKSGVYSPQSSKALGGHAIKIIGWGTLSGQDYWMVQNSWTTTWGDKGYFLISQTNSCGISDGGVAGTF